MEELCGKLGVEMQDFHGAVPLLKEKRSFGKAAHLILRRKT
jgi:hypothetical protein